MIYDLRIIFKAATASTESPNLMLVEAVPIVEPNDVEPCDPCGGGGGGSSRIDDNGRGDPTGGPTYGTQTYFVITSLRTVEASDGDGAYELQTFVKQDDNYSSHNMPLSYMYRFDNAFRENPMTGQLSNNTLIYGADAGVYDIPDVNSAGTTYSFFVQRWYRSYDANGNPADDWSGGYGYFPLFDLTHQPGPWRLLLSDDDKDYRDFSRRRQSEYEANIQTYHMDSGGWTSVNTGFTVDEKTYGSSDDPQFHSGVRRITESNASDRRDSFGNITAEYNTSSGLFRYKFALYYY